MPKKKSPSVLYLSNKELLKGKMLTCNRAARRAYPTAQTQKLWPIRKDRLGNYYREDRDAIRKEQERIRAAERRRSESLHRESEAAKKMLRLQKANQGHAALPPEVQTPVGERDAEEGTEEGTEGGTDGFSCADHDG